MFAIGDRVCLKIDKSKIGVITSVWKSPSTEAQYKVFHDAKTTTIYYEDQLEAIKERSIEKVDFSRFLELYAIQKHRTNSPDTIFSLNTGKIDFIPFQFRPLTRILNAERPRILIADEVGVGKTIEAGIILKEFEKRENIESALIICPKDLTMKWRMEMKTKFGEAFEVLSSDRLNYCLGEMEAEGVWPYECRKCIVGLEMLRREENIDRLLTMEDVVGFDMLIVDEAHHAINRSSRSHHVVEYFCNSSEIAVFLSATPLQLGSSDLFSLLNLLVPEEFIDESVFSAMAAPNRYINTAVRYIRTPSLPDWREKAAEALSSVCVNDWAERTFRNNRVLNYWIARFLNKEETISDEDRISSLRDIESLHTFAHVINRTKRKDIGAFTIREPVTILTSYDVKEQAFYEAAGNFKFSSLCQKYGRRTANFIMSTVERQITSSLPAFVSLLDDFIARGIVLVNQVIDDYDEEYSDYTIQDKLFLDWAKELKKLASQLPGTDSKARKLLRIIEDTVQKEPAKLLVFSFFKHTLRYLQNVISEQGYRVEVITGDTSMDKRAEIRDRFRMPKTEPNAIDILLCSEVGCEGLDYEFCNRMVNYDIPWNPMKIEQRIGRIDRFGQKSPKIQIYNFVTDGTVEERIFYRCYERLGIFSSTIGDLEGVLGNTASELNATAFDLSLSAEQQSQKAQQVIDNAIRLSAEKRTFENASRDLFLLDVENDNELISDERYLQIRWQMQLVKDFFRHNYPDTILSDTSDARLRLRMYKDTKAQLLASVEQMKRKRMIDRNDQQVITLERFLSSDEQVTILNFDSADRELADREMAVSATHPFIQMALSNAFQPEYQVVTACRTKCHSYLQKGKYLFCCADWEQIGYRQRNELQLLLLDCSNGELIPIEPNNFEKIILGAEDTEMADEIDVSVFDSLIFEKRLTAKKRLQENNTDIISRKLSTLNKYYSNQITRAERSYFSAENEKIRIMYKSRVQKLKTAWESRKALLTEKERADIVTHIIAYGVLEVQ